MKKLTLSVDSRIVARAKQFARDTSVSRLVESDLDATSCLPSRGAYSG